MLCVYTALLFPVVATIDYFDKTHLLWENIP